MKTHHRTSQRFASASGFTIIELMVTITIIVLVTGVIMLQYSSFNSSVLLTSQAYLTAFDIREAQSLAIGVRGQGTQFREEYGLAFDMTKANPSEYLLFQDDDDRGVHTPVEYRSGEEIGVPYKIDPRFRLVNICATNSVSRTCYAADPATSGEVVSASLHDLVISFKRPDFDAAFYSSGMANIQTAELKFGTHDSEIVRTVTIYSTGQIRID